MIIEISVVPIGVGESLSRYVGEVVKIFRENNIKYKLTPMGTVIEVDDFSELCLLLEKIKGKLEEIGVPRIYTVIKIDWRKKNTSMEYKVKSVEEKIKN